MVYRLPFPQFSHKRKFFYSSSLQMRAFRYQRQNRFLVLVHFHGIVVKKLSLVTRLFHVPDKHFRKFIQALLNHKWHKYLKRRSKFPHQIIYVILVMSLANNKLTIFIHVKYLGSHITVAEFPELLICFLFIHKDCYRTRRSFSQECFRITFPLLVLGPCDETGQPWQ